MKKILQIFRINLNEWKGQAWWLPIINGISGTRFGLSDSGFDILYTLCDIGDGCLQKDICDATMLSKQTIHSSVQKLAKDGYLSLQPGKGRDLHIHLTPAGRALMEEKIAPAIQIENLAFTDMTDDEQAEFLRLNRKYADSLRKHAAQL